MRNIENGDRELIKAYLWRVMKLKSPKKAFEEPAYRLFFETDDVPPAWFFELLAKGWLRIYRHILGLYKWKVTSRGEEVAFLVWGEEHHKVIMQTFSQRLKAALEQKGMSRRKLAKLTGLTEASLCRYCAGDRGITMINAMKLANVLGVDVS